VIGFIETKTPDFASIQRLLTASAEANQWTNFGPVSRRLEARVRELVELPEGKAAVACASGTAALHALVRYFGFRSGRALRWVVSAYTWPCQRQGALSEARVVDCDSSGVLDLARVRQLAADSYDGIVVTNLFGAASPVEEWSTLARERGKILIFDSAACFLSTYRGVLMGGFGDAEIFSFHHTKPCGFGEGGVAIVNEDAEEGFRSLINFGLTHRIDTGSWSTNGKMSDVAAAFILDRLGHAASIKETHRAQFERIAAVAESLGLLLLCRPEARTGFPSLVPLLFPGPVASDHLINTHVKLHRYYPAAQAHHATARDLCDRMVAFPCHAGLASLSDADAARVLQGVLDAGDRSGRGRASSLEEGRARTPSGSLHGG
jgi:dTDP-4-amino-4,6-dideoxygalactose transaminase